MWSIRVFFGSQTPGGGGDTNLTLSLFVLELWHQIGCGNLVRMYFVYKKVNQTGDSIEKVFIIGGT